MDEGHLPRFDESLSNEKGLPIEAFLAQLGPPFATFDARTQDSGNVSYGIEFAGHRLFAKTAGDPAAPHHSTHAERVDLLRNGVELRRSVSSRLLPELHGVIESPTGPGLVYAWVEGELLRAPPEQRNDPNSPFQRFAALPPELIEAALDELFLLHVELIGAGWIANDFYDGCLIYDFSAHRLHVVDLDCYRRGPFVNELGRLPGSSRFMAPEEFQKGARIDERTTVFNLARAALLLLSRGQTAAFRGGPQSLTVLQKASAPEPEQRFGTVAEFVAAWRAARLG
ncbi:MAG TPA: hypothetical protein VLC09_21775 [Polyangiaceae bacterium]|nr:hypothetical protein [Polyangiaceae bacterium]